MNAVFDTIIECGDAKKVDQLLAQLPQPSKMINETDYRRRTALHLAVEYGLDDVVELLLSRGIDVLAKDCGGFTALHLAAELGHDKIVLALLTGGENPLELAHEKAHDALTALHLAVIRGRTTIVKQLLEATSLELLNVEDKRGRSALYFAVGHANREEIVDVLLDSVKSTSDGEDLVMLHYAIRSGYDHIVARLLAQSPELVDVVDSRGCSALELAARKGSETIVMQLLAQRPNSSEVGGKYDGTVLHLAVDHGLDTIVAHLVADKPELIGEVNSQGQTALHLAAQRSGCDKIVSQLLDKCHGLIDVVDGAGKTALHYALRDCSHVEIKTVACLLAHKPAVLDETMLLRLLSYTEDEPYDELVKTFLEQNPQLVRSSNSSRCTVLHLVFDFRDYKETFYSEDLMQTVWEMNPEALHIKNAFGNTPFHVAIQSSNFFAIELVRRKFSLDEIVDAYDACNRPFPEEFLDETRECLLLSLNKDVIRTVIDYFNSSSNQRMKEEREKQVNRDPMDSWEFYKRAVGGARRTIFRVPSSLP